jgi:hypothetical protein
MEEIAVPLIQLSSKAKENGDHSAQVTAGNAVAVYERQRDNDTGLALSALVQMTIAAQGIPQA